MKEVYIVITDYWLQLYVLMNIYVTAFSEVPFFIPFLEGIL